MGTGDIQERLLVVICYCAAALDRLLKRVARIITLLELFADVEVTKRSIACRKIGSEVINQSHRFSSRELLLRRRVGKFGTIFFPAGERINQGKPQSIAIASKDSSNGGKDHFG